MLQKRTAHGAVAGLLAPAVNPERVDRVVLAVGIALGAVEHVIGREVNQGDPGVMAGGSEVGRAGAIAGPGGVGFALGAIHRGIGRRVDDEIRALARHRGDDRLTPGDVDTVTIVCRDIVACRPGEAAQLAPDLAAGAKHQKLHRIPCLFVS